MGVAGGSPHDGATPAGAAGRPAARRVADGVRCRRHAGEPTQLGLDRIDQRTGLDHSYHYPSDASEVTLYVIDTGVDATHPGFVGRVAPGKEFLGTGTDSCDADGHGTRLAGIAAGGAYGVAKGAQIVPVRVLDKEGGGATDTIIAGVDWVARNAQQPAVAVLGIDGVPNSRLDAAVRGLAAVMPVAVPAGGESADTCDFSPARAPGVLTVAASDNQDRVATTSKNGHYTGLQWNSNTATVADFDGDGHQDIFIGNYFPDSPVLDDSVDGGVVMNESLSHAANGGGGHLFRFTGATPGVHLTASYQRVEDALPAAARHGWTLAVSSVDFDRGRVAGSVSGQRLRHQHAAAQPLRPRPLGVH